MADALGYARPRDAVSAHCKGGVVLPLPSGGGIQDTVFIPESDVYRLVMRSKLPGAERFHDWVVEEVLPTIREKAWREQVEKDNHKYDVPYTELGAGVKMQDGHGSSIAMNNGGLQLSAAGKLQLNAAEIRVRPPVVGEQPKTMSSMEIAEICEKRHDNVMADIQRILSEDGIDALKFKGVYLGGNGQERPCYHLPRFECDLVVSGYSVKYRAAIIRRWHDLEAKEAARPEVKSLTLRETLVLNIELLDKNEALALVNTEQANLIEEQASKVEFFDPTIGVRRGHRPTNTASVT